MGTVHPSRVFGEYEVVTLTNGTFRENAYLVLCAGAGLLIDPGSEAAFIEAYCDSRAVHPEKIVLTHGHFDHLGAADALAERYGITCQINEQERKLVRQAATYGFRFDRGVPIRVPRNVTYFEGTSLDWSGGPIEVIPTPGHTSGSVSLSINSALVFTGDTLFNGKIGPTNYPESDPGAIETSVRMLIAALPDECAVFPGHGRPWTVREARTWLGDLSGAIPQQVIF